MEIRELTIEDGEGKVVTFKVAPTPIAKLAKCRQFMAKTPEELDEEAVGALVEAVFWGARRAGSKITLEWLQVNVDAHNIAAVARAFREVNLPKMNGTGAPPGESPAAIPLQS